MPFDSAGFVKPAVPRPKVSLQARRDLAILRKARDGVELDGWTQNSWGFANSHCAVGWIKVLTRESHARGSSAETSRICSSYLLPEIRQPSSTVTMGMTAEGLVIRYNDNKFRRKSDIVRMFNNAIHKLEVAIASAERT